jgi:hypothetical protein
VQGSAALLTLSRMVRLHDTLRPCSTDTLELSNQRLTLTALPHLSVKVPGAATDISVHIDAHYCASAWAIYNLRYRDSTSATVLADTLESLRWCVSTPKRAIYNQR